MTGAKRRRRRTADAGERVLGGGGGGQGGAGEGRWQGVLGAAAGWIRARPCTSATPARQPQQAAARACMVSCPPRALRPQQPPQVVQPYDVAPAPQQPRRPAQQGARGTVQGASGTGGEPAVRAGCQKVPFAVVCVPSCAMGQGRLHQGACSTGTILTFFVHRGYGGCVGHGRPAGRPACWHAADRPAFAPAPAACKHGGGRLCMLAAPRPRSLLQSNARGGGGGGGADKAAGAGGGAGGGGRGAWKMTSSITAMAKNLTSVLHRAQVGAVQQYGTAVQQQQGGPT